MPIRLVVAVPLHIRLLSLVLAPTVGLGVVANAVIEDHRQQVSDARRAVDAVELYRSALGFQVGAESERIPVEATLVGNEYGLTDEQIEDLLGMRLGDQVVMLRTRLDELAPALTPQSTELAAAYEAAVEMRASIDDGTADRREVAETNAALLTEATDFTASVLAEIEAVTGAIGGSGDLVRATRNLEDAGRFYRASSELFGRSAQKVVPGTQVNVDSDDVAGAAAEMDEQLTRLLTRLEPEDAATLRATIGSAESAAYWDYIAAFRRGEDPVLETVDEIAATFAGAVLQGNRIAELLDLLGLRAVDEARAVELQAIEDQEAVQQLLLVVAGATIVVWFLVAWSLTRPLRRLARRAKAISAGDLGTKRRRRTMREVETSHQALDELVATLQLSATQAEALATGRLRHPALSETVPGALGKQLQESVALLRKVLVDDERLREQLKHENTHDSLTGLSNRSFASETIDRSLSRAARKGETLALLYLDLDGFKLANDEHGHAVGDAVLVEASKRLLAEVRSQDMVARMGGDEFLVLLDGTTESDAMVVAERLLVSMSRSYEVDGRVVPVGVSIGLALAGMDGPETAESIIRQADAAVLRAKALGHDGRAPRGADQRWRARPLPAAVRIGRHDPGGVRGAGAVDGQARPQCATQRVHRGRGNERSHRRHRSGDARPGDRHARGAAPRGRRRPHGREHLRASPAGAHLPRRRA
jgi:diguanylate cyclase (GGDEF)-like protein